MYYKELVDPPVSQKYLGNFLKIAMQPSLNNTSTTLVTGAGLGIASLFRYILRCRVHFATIPQDKLYIMFDCELLNDETRFYKEALFPLSEYLNTSKLLNTGELTILKELLEKPLVTSMDFAAVIHHLTYDKNLMLTFIIENAGLLYQSTLKTKNAEGLLSLPKINPMKTSYIFLTNHEFYESTLTKLQGLASYFTQNFVWGRDLLFDRDCCQTLFEKNGRWANKSFDAKIIEKANNIAFGDPSIQKHIALQAINNSEFEALFLEQHASASKYATIGTQFLNVRYTRLIAGMFPSTLQQLIEGKGSEFTINTGLITNSGKYINPLFEEFCKKQSINVDAAENDGVSFNDVSRTKLTKLLTVKELTLFEELETNAPNVVTRDALAEILWGENWTEFYSDWALNKQISNLRKKMESLNYPRQIKVLKTEGFMLL